MRHNIVPINVGDWVYSDSPGIWQVYRIIEGAEKPRSNLVERKRTRLDRFVYSKRMLDKSWKPSFRNEAVSADLIRPLSGDDKRHLEEFLANNPQAVRDLRHLYPQLIFGSTFLWISLLRLERTMFNV